jgi:hypothetical protein
VAFVRDHGVRALDEHSGAARGSGQADASELVEELGCRRAARRDATAGTDEVPGSEPLAPGKWLEERRRTLVGERQERESFAPIGCRDCTRREAAEPSAAVVDDNGPEERGHRADSAAGGSS